MSATPACIALVGNPNCGKTALFNLLTGARQKVANYAGVTVERKQGSVTLADGDTLSIVDLPGTYSLNPTTADEAVTHDVLMGLRPGEPAPDGMVAVVDATNLRMNLRLVLQLRTLGRPMVVALNMMDVARAHGLQIDVARLSQELDLPVIETVAVDNSLLGNWLARLRGRELDNGREALLAAARQALSRSAPTRHATALPDQLTLQLQVKRVLAAAVPQAARVQRFNHKLDAVVMHPVWGLSLLALLLMLV
ncbi:MAG: ferrous iron transport protein, partial [Pseudomonadota bacterium]